MPDALNLRRWDVICRVVDHYGDAGVCLRLARQLAARHGCTVRLLADRPEVVLDLIQPRPDSDTSHGWRDRSGVLIVGWDAPPQQADVVLETFSGDLPPAILDDMRGAVARGRLVPVWLDLEYLSAEPWVESCHGLPSPQPGGLTRWFAFPGFTARTAGLPGPQMPLTKLPPALADVLAGTGLDGPGLDDSGSAGRDVNDTPKRPLTASVFCYRDSPLPALLDAMQSGARDVRLLVPGGMPGGLGGRSLGPQTGDTWRGGRLTLVRMPFVDQDAYDAILAACDLNLVRGEDSFVRAQWAARPLLWAAYRQPDDAHLDKVDAWLARSAMPQAWADLNRWFNGAIPGPGTEGHAVALWRAAIDGIDTAREEATRWRRALLELPRLDDVLVDLALQHASRLQ